MGDPSLERRVDALEQQMLSFRREAQRTHEWLDTVNSHWHKRVWWWLRGYCYHKPGRWWGKDRSW